MPLLLNRTSNSEQFGPYDLQPDHWGFLPKKIYNSMVGDADQRFEHAEYIKADIPKARVVLFSGCPFSTTGGGQQPTQIAKALSQLGCEVLFVQVAPEQSPNSQIKIYQEPRLFSKLLPEPTVRDDYEEMLEEFQSSHCPNIALFTFPSGFLSGLSALTGRMGYINAYWCLDDWEEITQSQLQSYYSEAAEKLLIQNMNHCFATADSLETRVLELGAEKCTVIPNGYSPENFQGFPDEPDDLHIGDRTIVYWGELQGRWFNWQIVKDIAMAKPEWEINLIGPFRQAEHILDLPNVHYLDEKPVDALFAYGFYSDFGIIPFHVDKLSNAVNPIKAYEYLFCGLPIFTTPLNELKKFPCVYEFETAAEFIEKAENVTNVDPTENLSFMLKATWKSRAETFLENMLGT